MLNSELKYIIESSNLKWEELVVPSKTVLLEEGKVAKSVYFILEGAIRLYSLSKGNEITLQFFFENCLVASAESLMKNSPSKFVLETIEPTKVLKIHKSDWFNFIDSNPALKEKQYAMVNERLYEYMHLLLGQIELKPEERYLKLIQEKPHILQRVPLQYVASYLGITTVSLSRIRSRIKL